MGKVLIVNTGPTAYERAGLYPQADRPEMDALLTKWAQAAAERLAEYEVKVVYACPVPGAGETAEIIAGSFALKVDELPGMDYAQQIYWRGLSPEDAAIMDCSFSQAPPEIKVKLPFDSGIGELRERVAAALDNISVKHKKETVVVVSHRALTVIMILHLLHMDNLHYRQIAQDAGAVNLFEIRFKVPSAIYINDTCHLHGLI